MIKPVKCLNVILFFLLVNFQLPGFSFAQSSACDPSLKSPKNHPFGYSQRTDRCEGVYTQEVSSSSLDLVSFTGYFENYDLKSGKSLKLNWKTPASASVQLRAQGIRQKLYYRMDAKQEAAKSQYSWATNVLSALSIPRKDVGVLAWADQKVGNKKERLYLPLLISQTDSKSYDGNYQLILMPGREMKEIYLSLASAGSLGGDLKFIKDGEALEYGYYPASRKITVPLSLPGEAGYYFLEIGATHKSGGSSTLEMWFYHPGKN